MGFIKLSVDASVNDAGFKAGCGGVARNHRGEFMFGFTQKIDPCSVVEPELLAIYHGVLIAISKGERRLVVDTDSQEAFQLLMAGSSSQHSLSRIIDGIGRIVNANSFVRWSKVPKELNKVDDILAKHILFISSSCEFYDIAPNFNLSSLLEDKMGSVFL